MGRNTLRDDYVYGYLDGVVDALLLEPPKSIEEEQKIWKRISDWQKRQTWAETH